MNPLDSSFNILDFQVDRAVNQIENLSTEKPIYPVDYVKKTVSCAIDEIKNTSSKLLTFLPENYPEKEWKNIQQIETTTATTLEETLKKLKEEPGKAKESLTAMLSSIRNCQDTLNKAKAATEITMENIPKYSEETLCNVSKLPFIVQVVVKAWDEAFLKAGLPVFEHIKFGSKISAAQREFIRQNTKRVTAEREKCKTYLEPMIKSWTNWTAKQTDPQLKEAGDTLTQQLEQLRKEMDGMQMPVQTLEAIEQSCENIKQAME